MADWHGLTVSAGLAGSLMAFAVERGAARAPLLAAAGLAEAALADPDARVAMAGYVRLMRASQRETGDPALALHFGARDDMAQFSVVGLLGLASATMLDALAQLNRYGQLVIEVDLGRRDRFSIERRGDAIWLIDTRQHANDFPELTESTFARMTAGSRRQFGNQPVIEARVTHAPPPYAAEYEMVFGAPVQFGAAENALRFDPGWLTMPVALAPRFAFGILARHADALLAELEASHSFRGRVEARLMPQLHRGPPPIAAMAHDLGVSRATLYRRLREEGATYEAVIDALRQRLALDYLQAGKVSVNEIAYLVGFSDPAAFSRAFKRWTGKSPGSMRGAGR